MPVRTPVELRADLLCLRTAANADTIDAVISLLEQYGVLSGLTPEEAAAELHRSAIRVRQLANGGDLEGIRLGSGKRSTLLLSAVSVDRLSGSLAPDPPRSGRRKQRE